MASHKVVYLWGRRNRLPVDVGDPLVQRVFTRGQCTSFARALHKLTGWPLAVLCYGTGDEDDVLITGMDDFDGYLNQDGDHVICIRPDGMFVDVYGAWAPGERWNDLPVAVVVPEDEVAQIGWDIQNVKAALPFAKALLPSVQLAA